MIDQVITFSLGAIEVKFFLTIDVQFNIDIIVKLKSLKIKKKSTNVFISSFVKFEFV